MKAHIWDIDSDTMVGTIELKEEEAKHFMAAPHCVASVALTDEQIKTFNLESDTNILVDVE